MPSIFITVILRVVDQGLSVASVIQSIARQEQCREIIVINDTGTSYPRPEPPATASLQIKTVDLSWRVNDHCFLIAGQMVSYEACLLWNTTLLMPDGLCKSLHPYWDEDHVVGIVGRRFTGSGAWSDSQIIVASDYAIPVDYVSTLGMLTHQKYLQYSFDSYHQHVGMRVCAYAINGHGARCLLAPVERNINVSAIAGNEHQTSEYSLNELEIAHTANYTDYNRRHKDWPEINLSILPNWPTGTHFTRLSEQYNNVLVLGCQRSGTTWLAHCLGSYLDDAFGLDENQTFNILLDEHHLPPIHARHLVYQTTFIGHEVTSYLATPPETHLVLLVRNPFSVCYSLLYNFQMLDVVYEYRRRSMQPGDVIQDQNMPQSLLMALSLYNQSMRTAAELIQSGRDHLHVVEYDHAVLHLESVLRQLAHAIGASGVKELPNALVADQPRKKRQRLSATEQEWIETHAAQRYGEVLDLARERGVLLASPHGAASYRKA